MRAFLLLLATLLAMPAALAGPVQLWGDHPVGPCDYWQSPYTVGDSYRLTCAAAGHTVYFHQGQAGLVWECGYWVDGHDYYGCGPIVD